MKKAPHKNFYFITAEKLTRSKAEFLRELRGSVEEVKLAKQAKVKLQSARDFLKEL